MSAKKIKELIEYNELQMKVFDDILSRINKEKQPERYRINMCHYEYYKGFKEALECVLYGEEQ